MQPTGILRPRDGHRDGQQFHRWSSYRSSPDSIRSMFSMATLRAVDGLSWASSLAIPSTAWGRSS